MDAKIDNWIKENPKDWDYIQAMPRDRLERTVVLNEVRQIEAQQRIERPDGGNQRRPRLRKPTKF